MKANTISFHSAALNAERSMLIYDTRTHAYQGYITITNHSRQAIQGPLQLVMEDLSLGVTLLQATGQHRNRLAICVPLPSGALLPGGSIEVPVAFRTHWFRSLLGIDYRLRVLAGSFQQEPIPAATMPDPSRVSARLYPQPGIAY